MKELIDDIVKGINLSGTFDGNAESIMNEISDMDNENAILRFSQLIQSIVNHLRKTKPDFCEPVSQINDLRDLKIFCCELRELLRELDYPKICDANELSELIHLPAERLRILDFLNAEQIASSMIAERIPKQIVPDTDGELFQTICQDLLGVDVSHCTVSDLFTRLERQIREILNDPSAKQSLGKPLLTFTPTAKQWEKIEHIYQLLFEDYLARREMWFQRLDVTIKSFLWSQRTKDLEANIMNVYSTLRKLLPTTPSVKLSDLLAAREDLTLQQKTCAYKAGSVFKLKKFRIGSVPDRGGRVEEFEPMAKETFEAQQHQRMAEEQRKNQRGRGGRGGFRGSRGGPEHRSGAEAGSHFGRGHHQPRDQHYNSRDYESYRSGTSRHDDYQHRSSLHQQHGQTQFGGTSGGYQRDGQSYRDGRYGHEDMRRREDQHHRMDDRYGRDDRQGYHHRGEFDQQSYYDDPRYGHPSRDNNYSQHHGRVQGNWARDDRGEDPHYQSRSGYSRHKDDYHRYNQRY